MPSLHGNAGKINSLSGWRFRNGKLVAGSQHFLREVQRGRTRCQRRSGGDSQRQPSWRPTPTFGGLGGHGLRGCHGSLKPCWHRCERLTHDCLRSGPARPAPSGSERGGQVLIVGNCGELEGTDPVRSTLMTFRWLGRQCQAVLALRRPRWKGWAPPHPTLRLGSHATIRAVKITSVTARLQVCRKGG